MTEGLLLKIEAVSGSGLTSLYLSQVSSYPLKFGRQIGIRCRTFAQTIDRLTEAAEIAAQSHAEVGKGQVILMPN